MLPERFQIAYEHRETGFERLRIPPRLREQDRTFEHRQEEVRRRLRREVLRELAARLAALHRTGQRLLQIVEDSRELEPQVLALRDLRREIAEQASALAARVGLHAHRVLEERLDGRDRGRV